MGVAVAVAHSHSLSYLASETTTTVHKLVPSYLADEEEGSSPSSKGTGVSWTSSRGPSASSLGGGVGGVGALLSRPTRSRRGPLAPARSYVGFQAPHPIPLPSLAYPGEAPTEVDYDYHHHHDRHHHHETSTDMLTMGFHALDLVTSAYPPTSSLSKRLSGRASDPVDTLVVPVVPPPERVGAGGEEEEEEELKKIQASQPIPMDDEDDHERPESSLVARVMLLLPPKTQTLWRTLRDRFPTAMAHEVVTRALEMVVRLGGPLDQNDDHVDEMYEEIHRALLVAQGVAEMGFHRHVCAAAILGAVPATVPTSHLWSGYASSSSTGSPPTPAPSSSSSPSPSSSGALLRRQQQQQQQQHKTFFTFPADVRRTVEDARQLASIVRLHATHLAKEEGGGGGGGVTGEGEGASNATMGLSSSTSRTMDYLDTGALRDVLLRIGNIPAVVVTLCRTRQTLRDVRPTTTSSSSRSSSNTTTGATTATGAPAPAPAPPSRFALARATLDVLVPVASRVGCASLKSDLEDLCLWHLRPDVHARLSQQYRSDVHVQALSDAMERVRVACRQAEVETVDVRGRLKSLMGIHRKAEESMARVATELPDGEQDASKNTNTTTTTTTTNSSSSTRGGGIVVVRDAQALRILVQSKEDCYRALRAVQGAFPGGNQAVVKDYIRHPKANGYRSLHVIVPSSSSSSSSNDDENDDASSSTPASLPLEVQIRTVDMHAVCEYGAAAHWRYKEEEKGGNQEEAALSKKTKKKEEETERVSNDVLVAYAKYVLSWEMEAHGYLSSSSSSSPSFTGHISGAGTRGGRTGTGRDLPSSPVSPSFVPSPLARAKRCAFPEHADGCNYRDERYCASLDSLLRVAERPVVPFVLVHIDGHVEVLEAQRGMTLGDALSLKQCCDKAEANHHHHHHHHASYDDRLVVDDGVLLPPTPPVYPPANHYHYEVNGRAVEDVERVSLEAGDVVVIVATKKKEQEMHEEKGEGKGIRTGRTAAEEEATSTPLVSLRTSSGSLLGVNNDPSSSSSSSSLLSSSRREIDVHHHHDAHHHLRPGPPGPDEQPSTAAATPEAHDHDRTASLGVVYPDGAMRSTTTTSTTIRHTNTMTTMMGSGRGARRENGVLLRGRGGGGGSSLGGIGGLEGRGDPPRPAVVVIGFREKGAGGGGEA